MKKEEKLSRAELQSYPPIWETAVCYLLLDRFSVPGWVWGIAGTLFALLWIGRVALMFQQKEITLDQFVRKDGR